MRKITFLLSLFVIFLTLQVSAVSDIGKCSNLCWNSPENYGSAWCNQFCPQTPPSAPSETTSVQTSSPQPQTTSFLSSTLGSSGSFVQTIWIIAGILAIIYFAKKLFFHRRHHFHHH